MSIAGDAHSIVTVEFIGTATVILRCGEFTILTDPNFLHAGDHVHLGYGLQARRLTNPSRELDSLPPIDLVLLSHLHEDHFDREVSARLDKTLPLLTTAQAARVLQSRGFANARALETWQHEPFTKGETRLTVTAMPGSHAPGPLAAALPAVMGSLLDFKHGDSRLRLYISGDTLVERALYEIPRRYPYIDVALLHLGGTRVLGLMVTMDGEQGVRLMRIVAPRETIPIHFDDYDRFKSPRSDFTRAVARAGLTDRVRYIERGETLALSGRPRG